MKKIAFIGSGAMASAIASGLSQTKLFDQYIFCDKSKRALEAMKAKIPNCEISHDNAKALEADVQMLCVKPQIAKRVMNDLGKGLTDKHLIVSIMAGVTMDQIRSETRSKARIVRCMPNLPLLAHLGSVAFCIDEKSATKSDANLTEEMFSAMGYCVQITEGQMDLIPGVAGSSPAFVALFIDALADGGVQIGLPRELAARLAANAVYGAGGLLAQGIVRDPAQLRDLVCSPGGSSIAGVAALEASGFRHAVMDAVRETTKRTKELSKI